MSSPYGIDRVGESEPPDPAADGNSPNHGLIEEIYS